MSLAEFLELKPLYYETIDYERMPRIYHTVKFHFRLPKIIHIVGTNGKGSTGRYLANALHVKGYKVGHYTSPHILKFNERIWIDSQDVDDALLEKKHELLLKLLGQSHADDLSYFEYTTLLGMLCFEECDYVVLEAGLGGEYDATNVFDKVLSIFTPIDIDHQAFLGSDIKSIATTKIRSLQKQALIAKQHHHEVYEVFETIATEKKAKTYRVEELLEAEDFDLLRDDMPHYMQENMMSAIAALKLLHVSYDEASFKSGALFGRVSKIAENITLDVGHNVLAARAIAKHFKGKKLHLIYNSYADKDYREILKTLKPILSCVEIIAIDSIRGEDVQALEKVLDEEGIGHQKFLTCKEDTDYLVFGSFSVAEAFLKIFSFKL
ncbi:MAG: bifunctional folylpolyglutamate synthase/dihydrofolate synthase [Campylobacterota bacterium]|nr:bifunctional folylpolyglutamate synthase/dihydrofolate synthase [Campylobacterota bacterium]